MKTYAIIRGRKTVAKIDAGSIDDARVEAIRLDARNHGATIRRIKRTVTTGERQPDFALTIDKGEAELDGIRDNQPW